MLGDDVVIADKSVANSYLVLMELLGVDINLSKSIISSNKTCEFAKKLIVDGVDFSPLGPKSLFIFLNSPQTFKDMVINNNLIDDMDVAVFMEQLTKLFSSTPLKGAR